MKRSRSSYEELSPRSVEHHPQNHTTEQYGASNAQASEYAEYCEGVLGSTENLDPLQQYLGSFAEPYTQANASNQSDVASTSADTQRNRSQARQALGSTQQSPPLYSDGVLRGVANHVEHRGLIRTGREIRRAHEHFQGTSAAPSYNTHHRSYSITSQRSTVTPMPNPPSASADFPEGNSLPYGPYRGLFLDSDGARDHRHLSTRFGRQPYIHPEDDPSINQVENDRNLQVGRIYDAMIRGDRAQDNPGSIAMKRWVNCAHYKSDLVEAFAHKVFDCLLVQVKEGFRGWHHNDYVDDDRKGEKEDREADCMSRLENIIDALEREKTICEDVVNSASQIRMFVNAPIAYAARKFQNRVGNSKRGRTKDTRDSNPRPTKARRTGGRQTRARSATVSEIPTSRDTTPQFQTSDAAAMPYYTTRSSQKIVTSPKPTYLAPRQPLEKSTNSMPQVPTAYREANVTVPTMMASTPISSSAMSRTPMSPPALPTSRSYDTHVVAMPLAQISPLLSTPSLSYSYHSLPPSPNDVKYPVDGTSPDLGLNTDNLDSSTGTPIHSSLATNDLLFPQQLWADTLAPVQAADSANYFEYNPSTSHVSLVDVEYVSPHTVCESTAGPIDFESYWNEQPGVQPFTFGGPLNSDLSQQ